MATDPELRHSLFPLTVFDATFQRTTFVTGWLVEGIVNATVLGEALGRVTDKWRMLAGRVHSINENKETKWYIKIPLGPLPPTYQTYALTTATSNCPLSTYVSIPIPQVSSSLPPTIFIHPSTPRQYTQWESTQHPLTCWHLTYFPAQANNGQAYTGIGFARSHGVFDGVGASYVMRALVAELKGEEWTAPSMPPLSEDGKLYVNPILELLEKKGDHDKQEEGVVEKLYQGYTDLGRFGVLGLMAWHLRERYWRGAERRICLLPKEAFASLVDSVRSALQSEAKDVTSGDILVAWIYKTLYASGISPECIVHCTNFASFRTVLAKETARTDPVMAYPHNAFLPVPYPLLSVSDVRSSSLHDLASLLATARQTLSKEHVVSAFETLQKPTLFFPSHPEADDSLTVSNVSASRILESDWSATGVGRTVCGYRYQLTPTELLFTNAVYIAGRLDDGSVVLDVALNKERMALLEAEVKELTTQAVESTNVR